MNYSQAAIEALDSIGLDELLLAADFQTRKERKYLVPRQYVASLVARLDVRVLEIAGARCFAYESIYFDTPDLVSYMSAARCRRRRFKVRTRTYADTGDCVLEVKTRDGRGRTVKHRLTHSTDDRFDVTGPGRAFVEDIGVAASTVAALGPVLRTTYRRATLVLLGGAARLTIDAGVEFRSGAGDHVGLDDLVLVETKTGGKPCAADRLLWRDGHRPAAFSKYGTGLAALMPALPANKWNPMLRAYLDRTGFDNAIARVTVELRGDAERWRSAVQHMVGERWKVVDSGGDVVIAGPQDSWSQTETVIVVDVSEAAASEIVRAYNRGVTAYVCTADAVVVVAHLNAVARRLSDHAVGHPS